MKQACKNYSLLTVLWTLHGLRFALLYILIYLILADDRQNLHTIFIWTTGIKLSYFSFLVGFKSSIEEGFKTRLIQKMKNMFEKSILEDNFRVSLYTLSPDYSHFLNGK